ncbi:thioesterase family protein [Hypoxylon sp. FL1150]|nr:thioesterase family protein [Hypoxylon sp. FL1150]
MASILRQQIALRQIAPSTYTADWHIDWTLGSTLFGGSIAAIIHHVAATHIVTEPTLAARDQPDILSMHVEFLRSCERCQSTIIVSPLKIGATASTIQLQLSQNGQLKAIALATTTNFNKPLGPTVPTDWTLLDCINGPPHLLPPPPPPPNFDRILTRQPDDHWLPSRLSGDIIRYGCIDETESMDATYLAMITDVIPLMSDTFLRNNGLYDAHAYRGKLERWAKENPGIPAEITNSVAETMRATLYNNTIHTKVTAKMLHSGKISIDITMCNSEEEFVCTAHQLILILEAERKFRPSKTEPVL